jgi:hypothetical protein
MLTDRYGLTLSTASPDARDAYVQGCEAKLTMYPGAIEAFDRAIAADPGFALARRASARRFFWAYPGLTRSFEGGTDGSNPFSSARRSVSRPRGTARVWCFPAAYDIQIARVDMGS